METPEQIDSIPFIAFTESEGFQITEEAKNFLNSLNSQKLGVISIVGKYRTGKSYFVNKVLLNRKKQKGFAVGPTINPCTKGIWLWKKLMNAKDFGAENDMDVLILDTEGFGGIDENVNHDTRIFLFSILLSSFFIYNSVGSIDEGALQSLSLIVNLAKDIKVKNKGENTDEEIKENFPTFLWVIRDFILSLENRKGEKMTSRKYLENALDYQKGVSETVQSKNKIRKMLKYFFQERDCITMVRPVETETDLKRLDSLDMKYLRPKFVDQLNSIRKKIYKKVKPKYIGGKRISASMLIEAAEAYTKAINKGGVPNIENAWTYICQEESEKAFKNCLKSINQKVKELENKGVDISDTENFKNIIRKYIINDFKDMVIGEDKDISKFVDRLEIEIVKKLEIIINDKKYEMRKMVEKTFDSEYFIIKQKLMQNEINNLAEARELLNNLKREISDEGDIMKNNIINDLIEKKEKEILNVLLDQKCKNEEKIKEAEEEAKNKILEMNSNLEDLEKNMNKRHEDILELKEKLADKKEEIKELKEKNKELKENLKESEKSLRENNSKFNEWKEEEWKNIEKKRKISYENYNKENILLEQKLNKLEKELLLSNQKVELYEVELKRKENFEKENENEKNKLIKEIENLKRLNLTSSNIDPEEVIKLKTNNIEYEKDIIELKMKNQYLKDQVDFFKSQNTEIKNMYDKFFFNFQPKRNEHDSNQSDLLSTNKILSSSLEKSQNKIKSLEEQVNYFKQFKKIVKYANSVQCFKCFRDINPNVFIEHLNQCKNEITMTKQKRQSNNNPHKPKKKKKIKFHVEKDFKSIIKSSIIETEDIFVKIHKTTVNNINKHPFIQYVITVHSKNQDNWIIKRRYIEFCNLYNNITEEYPDINLPKSSVLIQAYSYQTSGMKQEPLLEERKKSLEKFLNDLLKIKKIRYSGLLRDFLDLEEPMRESEFHHQYDFNSKKSGRYEGYGENDYGTNERKYLDYKEREEEFYDREEDISKMSKFVKSYNSSQKKKFRFNKNFNK